MGEAGPVASVGPDGRYVLVRQIGAGAMGTVHEARDTVLDRPVAVKLIDRRLTGDPTFHRRFANEAAILARLDGRSIVRVYDFGSTDDGMFLVTQFLADGDLGSWLREHGPLSARRAALLTAEVCDALDQAHRAGIMHRDVKPGNVLLRSVGDSLEGYLADFGIARPHDSELTTTGEVLGTPSYMAPEQHLGEEASAAGDVYAAGCVLWCALTGHRPYDGTPHQQAMGHLEGPVPQLDAAHPLNAVLARALAKDPAERYPSAAAMAAALRAAAAEVSDAAPDGPGSSLDSPTRPGSTVDVARRGRGRALLVGALAVLLVVALGGAGWAVLRGGHDTWRCSDGSTASSRSGCGLPSGAADITTVFPETSGCEQSTTQITERVYALRCDFGKDRGYTVTYSAWSSHRAALAHYLSPEAKLPVDPTTWTQDGERAGQRWVVRGKLRKASFLYDDVAYSVSVLGLTDEGLDAGIADILDGAAEPPSAFLPRKLG